MSGGRSSTRGTLQGGVASPHLHEPIPEALAVDGARRVVPRTSHLPCRRLHAPAAPRSPRRHRLAAPAQAPARRRLRNPCLPFHRLRRWNLGQPRPAAIARPADHLHAHLRGDVIKHLGAVFADRMRRRSTAPTGLVGDIDHDLHPRQMLRQRTAIALGGLCWPVCGWLSSPRASPPIRRHLFGATCSASDCSMSSTPCCSASSPRRSERRPKRLRSSTAISICKRVISACASRSKCCNSAGSPGKEGNVVDTDAR
jgi:hypothetical protein